MKIAWNAIAAVTRMKQSESGDRSDMDPGVTAQSSRINMATEDTNAKMMTENHSVSPARLIRNAERDIDGRQFACDH